MDDLPKRTILTIIALWMLCGTAWAGDGDAEKATHEETMTIGRTAETRFGKLATFRLNAEGNLLACDSAAKHIRVISPAGKVLATWKLPLAPAALWCCDDGTIYVAGPGKIAQLDKTGKVVKMVDIPDLGSAPAAGGRRGRGARGRGRLRPSTPSGIAVSKRDVFLAVGSGWSLRSLSTIVRFDRDLAKPKVIARDLRGCCQRLDLTVKGEVLYVAENARHRVVRYDRDGKKLSQWGSRDRVNLAGFGSCCNPMNLYFGSDGVLYTAESGLGRVKRYTPDGKFLGLVGYVGVARFQNAGGLAASCSNIAIAVVPGGDRVYVQDVKNNIVRVLDRKKPSRESKGTQTKKEPST